jgi:multiple sugar transport system ATP-binding protein
MATVELERVDKVFPDGTTALAEVTLRVQDGERVVVVGPSGCGKSTLLRIVAGLDAPTRGTLRIGGRVANELAPQERNVAMVFQDYALYPHMSVRGNLEFPLRMRGLARGEIERRVAWIAGLLGIGPLLERLPRQLSGGQRQRVAMGRALVREPAVFLLDEPLSNLDAKLRVQVRAEIEDLQRTTGITMLYVTHDQVEAMTLGDRIAVLKQGRLQQVATPRDLYERPANAFVAGFIGSPPMNLFPARLSLDADGRPWLEIAQGRVPLPASAALEALRARAGQKLTAGCRAEALRLAAEGDAGTLRGVAEEVECLGHETLVRARLGEDAFSVRLPGMQALAKGEPIALAMDGAQVHLFAEDGSAIGVLGEA